VHAGKAEDNIHSITVKEEIWGENGLQGIMSEIEDREEAPA